MVRLPSMNFFAEVLSDLKGLRKVIHGINVLKNQFLKISPLPGSESPLFADNNVNF